MSAWLSVTITFIDVIVPMGPFGRLPLLLPGRQATRESLWLRGWS